MRRHIFGINQTRTHLCANAAGCRGSICDPAYYPSSRSLSDLGRIGCESGKLAHVSRKFSLNSSLLGLEFTEKWPPKSCNPKMRIDKSFLQLVSL
uniref:Uncharacterized protein n=2 Tax=Candidatus Kentrum sp. FM TaxID=2126340 RepID=A0A450WUA8_9GAMM|nr:MAG: hypothetical protein BECKFM1743B_GA0114221_107123 [Candidatus Kentron sp. FM]